MRIRSSGFTLIEMAVVVSLLMITSSVAIVRMKQSITLLDADKAVNQVANELRYARQIALDDRRDVTIEFIAPDAIRITRQDGVTPTVVYSGTLPSGYSFGLPAGVSDTPDAYGNSAAITFNLQTQGVFRGDGTFTDAAGIVVNGTVFTTSGANQNARAITLTGSTGRTKIYSVSGSSWITR